MTDFLQSGFRDKRVFVTGHTGFKGSWLCLWLRQFGAETHGYALDPPTDPSNFTVANVADSLAQHTVGDVRDVDDLHRAVDEANPDIVLHLAAQSVVRTGFQQPLDTFATNVMGVANMLEVVRRRRRPCNVVVVTSDKCYENREIVWGYRENDPFGDHDPYGGSKGAAELVVRSYRDSFFSTTDLPNHGVKLASARAGNVIGGGDWTKDALLVDAFAALAASRPIEIRSPQAVRPWQHVLQALSGYLTLAAKLVTSDDAEWCSGWNIGPHCGDEASVREVIERYLALWGAGEWVDVSRGEHPREANILRLSIDKAVWRLGWRPAWGLNQTLAATADWRRHYEAGADMRSVCEQQIASYERDMCTPGRGSDAAPPAAISVDPLSSSLPGSSLPSEVR
jgi:CDP-glucose 4,6-dehydratase